MMFFTHLLFGTLSGLLGCNFFGCNNTFLFVAVAAAASAIPDIDHLSSRISRKLPPFAMLFSVLFKHRGFLHSFFPPLFLYFVLVRADYLIAAAVLAGYASHLLLDATTVKGVQPLYPVVKTRIRGFIVTNSFAEKIVALLLLITVIAVVFLELP